MGPSTSSALGLVRPLLGARPRVLPMPPQRVATPAAPACARGLTIVSSTAVTPRKKEHKPRTSRRQKKNDGFRVPHVGPVISGRQLVPPRFLGGVNGRLAANIWTRSAIDKLDGLMPSNESLRVLLDDLFTSDRGKALYDQLHSTLETTKLNASQDDLDALDAYADELKLTEPVRYAPVPPPPHTHFQFSACVPVAHDGLTLMLCDAIATRSRTWCVWACSTSQHLKKSHVCTTR